MKNKIIYILMLYVLTANAEFLPPSAENLNADKKLQNVMIYYPHWYSFKEEEQFFGKGWVEWPLIVNTKQRFKDHLQPKVPLYFPASNSPDDVADEIEMARARGIDVFLYCWYWYGGIQNMEEALEKGFLEAKNNSKMKFALLWANHDRRNMFLPEMGKERPMWFPAKHSEEDTLQVIDYAIEHYFKKPNYWKIDGKLYLCIFHAHSFVEKIGGARKTRELFEKIDKRLAEVGLPPIHWAGITASPKQAEGLKEAGFSSTTPYNINCTTDWVVDYADSMDYQSNKWREISAASGLPFMPTATQGWDVSPHCRDYEFPYPKRESPYGSITKNSRPSLFEKLVKRARDFALENPQEHIGVMLNAWNEWGEGSYILPERLYSYGFLDAVGRVLGDASAKTTNFIDPENRKLVTIPAPTYQYKPYGEDVDKQYVHFWKAVADKPAPTVVYFHGGNWNYGCPYDSHLAKILIQAQKRGFNVASVEYRFAREADIAGEKSSAAWPLGDSQKAIDFLAHHAKEWNIDLKNTIFVGSDAGAYIALWTAENGAIAPRAVIALNPYAFRTDNKYGKDHFEMFSFRKWHAMSGFTPSEKKYLLPTIYRNTPKIILFYGEKCAKESGVHDFGKGIKKTHSVEVLQNDENKVIEKIFE